jgi:hypothetical protein
VRLFLLHPVARGILVSAVFWWCVGYGWWIARLSHRTALVFAGLYVGGAIAFPYLELGQYGFVAWIAILDVVLVMLVYYRDVGLRDL